MLPATTKWPPRASIVTVARLATNIITGISIENKRRMDIPRLSDSELASMNFRLSGNCEFNTLINAEPIILSFMILLRESMTSLLFLNNTLTFFKTIKKVPPITGTIAITANASFQFIRMSNMDVPTITKTEEIILTKAIDTNIFKESISDVRFVNSFEGFDLRTKA
jgi:hypothetical protein